MRALHSTTRPAEEPTHYAACRDGRLMPSIFVRWEEGAAVMRPIGSQREYSFDAERVVSASEGEAILMQRRMEEVRDTYSFDLLSEAPVSLRVSHPTRKASVYIVTEIGDGWGYCCNCPGYHKSAIQGHGASCKHSRAVDGLAKDARSVGMTLVALYRPAGEPVTHAEAALEAVLDAAVAAEDW